MNYPNSWLADLNDQEALLNDPEAWSACLSVKAQAAVESGDVDARQLSDMLEFVEAGRLWGLSASE